MAAISVLWAQGNLEAASEPNTTQFSSAGAAVPMEYVLQTLRLPQDKGIFFPYLGNVL